MASSFSQGSVLALLITLAVVASGSGVVTEAVANGDGRTIRFDDLKHVQSPHRGNRNSCHE